jgi:hypothetical protein
MPLDAKELAKEKELNRELSDEEMDRLLIPRRSVGTWVTVGLVFVGLIGGAGYLFGARVLKAGRDYAAEVAAVGTPEQRRQAQEVLENANSKLTLWKLQHQGRLPSFEAFGEWEQFTRATDITGKLSPARGVPVCGPYLAAKPINPINNLSNVFTWEEGKVDVGSQLPAGAKAGFVYSKTAARLWVTDVAGTKVIDPAAPSVAPKPVEAPATKPAESKPADATSAETPAATTDDGRFMPTPAPTPTRSGQNTAKVGDPVKPPAQSTPAKAAPAKSPTTGGTSPKSRK